MRYLRGTSGTPRIRNLLVILIYYHNLRIFQEVVDKFREIGLNRE